MVNKCKKGSLVIRDDKVSNILGINFSIFLFYFLWLSDEYLFKILVLKKIAIELLQMKKSNI